MQRRRFLSFLGASLTVWPISDVSALQHISPPGNRKKILWIMLRGAMDSLHAVIPVFDPNLNRHRSALIDPIRSQFRQMDRGFYLHPDLKFLHKLYTNKQLTPIVATATSHRSRSHFDAQDALESAITPTDHDSGWLARALSHYHGTGLALAQSIPITLRGNTQVKAWYPSKLPKANDDLYERLMMLYQDDLALKTKLTQIIDTKKHIKDIKTSRHPKLNAITSTCAQLMRGPNGVDCAMIEMDGWDTHNNLVHRLSRQFTELDQGIEALQKGLQEQWKDTVVIMASEFGRTVAINGTKGSDHGTAGAIFLAGGAINGGQVRGAWPGLGTPDLYENRDLKATSNIFDWIATLTQQHWELSNNQIEQTFPNTSKIRLNLVK